MITKFIFSASILFLILQNAQAEPWQLSGGGDERGNGGDVVVCKSDQPFKIQLLDFYERKTYDPSFTVDLGRGDLVVEKKIQLYLRKLSRVSKMRAKKYEGVFKEFFSQVMWVRKTNLIDVPDSDHLFLPVGCELQQIAIQLKDLEQIPGKRYVINQDLWDLLDNNQKTGLVMHEIVYQETLANGHLNSVAARYLNSWLASSGFARVGAAEFVQYLKKINLPTYQMIEGYDELYVEMLPNQYTDGVVTHLSYVPILGKRVAVGPKSLVRFEHGKIRWIYNANWPEGFDFKIGPNRFHSGPISDWSMSFYRNGHPYKLASQDYQELELITSLGKIVAKFGFEKNGDLDFPHEVEFHDNGQIALATLAKPFLMNTPLSPDPFEIEKVGFNADGVFETGRLVKPTLLKYGKGTVLANNSFEVDPSGHLKRVGWGAGQDYPGTNDILVLAVNGKTIWVTGDLFFSPAGEVEAGNALPGQSIFLYGQERNLVPGEAVGERWGHVTVPFDDDQTFLVGKHELVCRETANGILFHPDYSLEGCDNLRRGSKFFLFGKHHEISSDPSYKYYAYLYPSGGLRKIGIGWGNAFRLEVVVRGRPYKTNGQLEFHPNGVISKMWASEDTYFENTQNQMVPVRRGNVELDQDGYLIKSGD